MCWKVLMTARRRAAYSFCSGFSKTFGFRVSTSCVFCAENCLMFNGTGWAGHLWKDRLVSALVFSLFLSLLLELVSKWTGCCTVLAGLGEPGEAFLTSCNPEGQTKLLLKASVPFSSWVTWVIMYRSFLSLGNGRCIWTVCFLEGEWLQCVQSSLYLVWRLVSIPAQLSVAFMKTVGRIGL